ncbi:MAG: N-methylhydantoinase A [Chloroflexi bacterium]|jgi:N-methylhydantoinase A|nr:MAG: N-methylhydantoinase A [Chloroflexota bacterium]
MPQAVLGVDVGGTFTDFVLLADGRLTTFKAPSTPQDSAEAVLQGVRELQAGADVDVVHGSTVATNAILERRGALTALITTKGFEDVIEIGRQARQSLYDLTHHRPPPLVTPALRFGADERVDHTGAVLQPLHPEEAAQIARAVADSGAEAVAVSLLFSFLNPDHEAMLRQALAELPNCPYVSLSSDVLPEYREFERTSTVVTNAYIGPLMSRYLGHLRESLGREYRVMQSSGGSISSQVAAAQPVRTVLSGPAGGVVGASYVASVAGHSHIITLDMGGTSTDVALCPGYVQETTSYEMGGVPISTPMTDIHTVGAGGGSVARVDEGGALVVGPQSVGADPGPACYGKGDQVAVTDANLVLGRLGQRGLLGGRMELDVQRSREYLGKLAETLGIGVTETAQGIIRVVNSNMERAIRAMSLERGFDPRDFTLVPFGGAGPMHACELAEELHIPRVLIPETPGVLSALGVAIADVVKDYSRTILGLSVLDAAALENTYQPMEDQGRFELASEGFADTRLQAQRFLDVRYAGQSYELTVPYAPGVAPGEVVATFHDMHLQRYGHSDPRKPVEVVNARLKMVGLVERPSFPPMPAAGVDASNAIVEQREVVFHGEAFSSTVYDRDRLQPGNQFTGPAIVEQMDATTVVPPGWNVQVDSWGNLLLTLEDRP